MIPCRKSWKHGGADATLLQPLAQIARQLNRVFDMITNSEIEVRVKATGAKMVIDGMQKIANRITMGVVLAGLIVGASRLMRVPTRFALFGYPGLAILCFVAAAGGFWLVISIFISDYKIQRKLRESSVRPKVGPVAEEEEDYGTAVADLTLRDPRRTRRA
jgi:ubiquinone biosynthesis protein